MHVMLSAFAVQRLAIQVMISTVAIIIIILAD
jgi:hypothetical protein